MDDVAVQAGVGKGTLFRAFGSREGLLNSLWAAKLASLRKAVEEGEPPLARPAPPQERAVAFIEALLTFKLRNRRLIRALELGTGVLQSDHYKWMHGLLQGLIEEAAPSLKEGHAGYAAHAFLAAAHIDTLEAMMGGGLSPEALRHAHGAHVRSFIRTAQTA